MTYEEALKNLKKCIAPFEVRDIVEQQQAEIERLKKLLAEADTSYNKCAKRFYKEAIKEFTERLKSSIYINTDLLVYQCEEVESVIDGIVKEMVGETNDR